MSIRDYIQNRKKAGLTWDDVELIKAKKQDTLFNEADMAQYREQLDLEREAKMKKHKKRKEKSKKSKSKKHKKSKSKRKSTSSSESESESNRESSRPGSSRKQEKRRRSASPVSAAASPSTPSRHVQYIQNTIPPFRPPQATFNAYAYRTALASNKYTRQRFMDYRHYSYVMDISGSSDSDGDAKLTGNNSDSPFRSKLLEKEEEIKRIAAMIEKKKKQKALTSSTSRLDLEKGVIDDSLEEGEITS